MTSEIVDSLPVHPMLLIALLIALYFLPVIIAAIRNMRHAVAISVLNVEAGVVFITGFFLLGIPTPARGSIEIAIGLSIGGWVAALVWSCMELHPKTK